MALGTNLKVKAKKTKRTEKTQAIPPSIQATEPPEVEKKEGLKRQYCVFKAGSERYAIGISAVKEVTRCMSVAPLPQMPQYLLGMSNVRGNVYGVMDLACYFTGSLSADERKFLLVLNDEKYKMALVISEVPDALSIADDEMTELNSASLGALAGHSVLEGTLNTPQGMIILLDIMKLISSEDFIA